MQNIWEAYFKGDHETVLRAGATAAETMHVAGLSLVALDRFDEGVTLLMSSLLVQPHADWYSNACVALLEKNQASMALPFAKTGLKHFPENVNILFSAGNALTSLDRHEEAVIEFLRALEADPNHWQSRMNLGNTYRRLGKLPEALNCYDVALTGDMDISGRIRTKLNRAVTLADMGQDEEALEDFKNLKATEDVNSAEMDFNISTLSLKLGDYENGWKQYERRWDCPMASKDVEAFLKPRLSTLEEGAGKRVLFCHEQGFGDSIQFSRYAPMFKSFAIDATILVPEPLQKLFMCYGIPVVTSRSEIDYDFECPMLSAPRLFGTTLDTIPSTSPYITVPKSEIIPVSDRLKVGVVWAGQARQSIEMKIIDGRRSIGVENFREIFLLDADFYSLQFGERADDFAGMAGNHPIKVLREGFSFFDTAKVIMNLDLVISVDTSTAHLAAALGKPTWILSRFDGCWRWLKGRSDSPWYPTVRLFQQKERLAWRAVLNEVREELEKLISS